MRRLAARVRYGPEGAGAVEDDQHVPATARAGVTVGDEHVPGQQPPILGSTDELAFFGGQLGPRDEAGTPLSRAVLGVPRVNRRPGDRNALERDIAEGKTLMSSSHPPTVAGATTAIRGWRGLPGRARLSLPFGEV